MLVYNCAKMPSICRNVHQRNPLQAVQGVTGAGNLGELDQGRTPGGLPYITLNYDTSEPNKKARRSVACPSNWHQTQRCPKGDQPPTVYSGVAYTSGYTGQRWIQANINFGDPGYNVIANAANTGPGGMFWSCDEWPPATTTQGGAGSSTYCAPQNYKCSSVMNALGPGVDSEQDIQGNIHSILRNRLTGTFGTPAANTVYQFYFKTMWDDDDDGVSAYVEFTDSNTGAEFLEPSAYKRDLETKYKYFDLIFSNGTMSSYVRPMTETEIDEHYAHIEKQILARNTSNLVATNLSTVPPVQQRFDLLSKAPPLPIMSITRTFIDRLAKIPVRPYLNQVLTLFSDALVPTTTTSAHPGTATASNGSSIRRDFTPISNIFSRQSDDECSADSPCPDGSCCNNSGGCGYGPDNCGAGNCTNTCNATALCGRDSLGGDVSCPLNVCCSYYGYCGVGTEYCDSPNPDSPCQEGFGSCSTVAAPSCGGSSATGRSIGYYQVSNSYSRQCQRITPSQIDTTGLTHLNLAFASIDPSSFEVVPVDSRDVALYTEFTALKTSTLQTWISIGGWDFNDPGPTQTTWSDLAASASTRATFISSLKDFMDKYGFQGVDIDWEYPGAPDRSGNPDDTKNFVSLLEEMRSAYGTSYGISATLPSSYWYLRWFDPKAMEAYVDFFGLMTYDLHGPWDAEVKDIGKTIIGQTNIPEIYNWTLPLWYDSVDPSKINMGLAYYGRGYTVASVDCMEVGCKWSSTSRAAPCTAFGGVMSLEEIESIMIPELGVEPTLDSDAMMKYLVWSDQWVGYDDAETIALKKSWASSHCFGGTMIWSIDLYSGSGSGNTPDGGGNSTSGDPGAGGGNGGSSEGNGGDSIVYIDPSIWGESNPVINCEPPCTFILPPLQLSSTTTITFPPYVTSLDVAWSTSTGWTHIIQTTTLTIPPVTITEIPAWEYTVTDTNTDSTVTKTFYVTSSILPPPFTITNDPNPLSESGVTHPPVTRTITPPPYPYSFTQPSSQPTTTTSSSTGVVAAIFPIVTYKPGTPGPICKSGCGSPCLIFCSGPCLLNCGDGGNDFVDPKDPDPPKRPTPTEVNDPLPTEASKVSPTPEPTDSGGDDPKDPEEEDNDDECAYEFNQAAPTYVDPNFGASGTQTISSASPPATPAPKPNPTPPSPNPATESLHCFNSGAMTGRGSMIDAVTSFCNTHQGTILDASDENAEHTLTLDDHNAGTCFGALGCTEVLHLSVTVTNGCRFTIDGPSPDQDCGRIFREAIDKCDTSSTKYKQGGTITSNCAVWDIDPNNWW